MRACLLGLFVVALLSCGPRVDTPRLDKVTPASIPFGSPERLLLTGSFPPDLSVELGSGSAPSLENRFEVGIGPERAYAVRFLSRDTLEATAPATLPPGTHDLTVTDAQGRTTTLADAIEVIDPGVQRLVFVTSMRAAHPGEWSEPIRVELRDPSGRPTPTALPRTLHVTSDSSTGRFALVGQVEGQSTLELTLAPGDTGVELVYQDATPGYHTLESTSLELAPITQTIAVGRLGPPTAVRFTRLPTAPLVAGLPVALALEVLDASGGPASLPATGTHSSPAQMPGAGRRCSQTCRCAPSPRKITASHQLSWRRVRRRLLTGKRAGSPLARPSHSALTGQITQEGRLRVQTVAPRSISPWV